MKQAFFIFTLLCLCITILFSCSNSNGGKFIGTWHLKGETNEYFTVEKDGDNYIIEGHSSAAQGGKHAYKFKDGSLVGGDLGLDHIEYIQSNGHLLYESIEWEKMSDNTESESSTSQKKPSDYNFEKHDDFKTFWIDFKKAVIAGDKDAVAKMTKFPFKDNRSNSGPDAKLFSCKTSADFINRYNEIFSPAVIKQIDTGKCSQSIAYDGDPENDNQPKIPDSYSLLIHLEAVNGWMAEFVFKKINGEYKMTDIPYAE